jgi:hypothetical protein
VPAWQVVLVVPLLLGACGRHAIGPASSTGAGGAGPVPVGDLCPSAGINKGGCDESVYPCHRTCGPLKSGFKNCTCTNGQMACGTCTYDPSHDYSCYALPAVLAACPPDPSDPDLTGMGLPQIGDTCSLPTCAPCGSSTQNGYRDSTGTPQVGYCVCSGPANNAYSCASAQDWPPVPPPAATGGAGSSGQGSGGDAGVAPYVPVGDLCATALEGEACAGSPPCHKTCGPLKSGNVNCACVAGAWTCPTTCSYDPAGDYRCFALSATMAACAEDPGSPDPTSMRLPMSGDQCNLPPCTPCGSTTSNAFRGDDGKPAIGACVCSSGLYSCASLDRWPPQR